MQNKYCNKITVFIRLRHAFSYRPLFTWKRQNDLGTTAIGECMISLNDRTQLCMYVCVASGQTIGMTRQRWLSVKKCLRRKYRDYFLIYTSYISDAIVKAPSTQMTWLVIHPTDHTRLLSSLLMHIRYAKKV